MSPAPALPELSPPVVLALVEGVREVGYREGVLALRGRPVWSGPPRLPLEGGGEAQVVPCVSALAAWEAVLAPRDTDWLVVITDRDQADLGDGLCAHFVDQRVIVPRLWQAVQQRFQARQITPSLAREPKQLAEALLAHSPVGGWPPTRAGVLSRDEALGALAERVLGLAPDRVDPQGVLEWTLDPANLQGLDRLDPAVREALFRWLDERAGVAGRRTLAVVEAGHGRDTLALALVAGLLPDPQPDRVRAAEVRGRLAHRYGGVTPTKEAARGLREGCWSGGCGPRRSRSTWSGRRRSWPRSRRSIWPNARRYCHAGSRPGCAA